MMNQTTNLTQWKNLTDDEKAAFDFEDYAYEFQSGHSIEWEEYTIALLRKLGANIDLVYRLKIEPEKWYYWSSIQGKGVVLGSEIIYSHVFDLLRPAKESEIPKQELSLEDRVEAEYGGYEVVMLEWEGDFWCMCSNGTLHTNAQSMKGFYKYVYFEDSEFYALREPTTRNMTGKTIHPIAALFEKAKS